MNNRTKDILLLKFFGVNPKHNKTPESEDGNRRGEDVDTDYDSLWERFKQMEENNNKVLSMKPINKNHCHCGENHNNDEKILHEEKEIEKQKDSDVFSANWGKPTTQPLKPATQVVEGPSTPEGGQLPGIPITPPGQKTYSQMLQDRTQNEPEKVGQPFADNTPNTPPNKKESSGMESFVNRWVNKGDVLEKFLSEIKRT